MAQIEHEFLPITRKRDDKILATCSCGWQALGHDSYRSGAFQAWHGHMYAMGFRTAESINKLNETQDG